MSLFIKQPQLSETPLPTQKCAKLLLIIKLLGPKMGTRGHAIYLVLRYLGTHPEPIYTYCRELQKL